MQARRNPTRATTNLKSHTGVRVQRQPVRSSRPAPERHLFGYKRGAAAPSRIAHVGIVGASRAATMHNMCADEDERSLAVSLFAGWIALSCQPAAVA